MRIVVQSLCLVILALGLRADVVISTNFSNLNRSIPDHNLAGLIDIRNISSTLVVKEVRVRLKITGATGRNGDLYAYLKHAGGRTVLLNRLGKSPQRPGGYSDPGLDVILDDNARQEDGTSPSDIHLYRTILFGTDNQSLRQSALRGVWASDGRGDSPFAVTSLSLRTATLASFRSLPVQGDWTLFIADVSPAGKLTLQSWGLEFTAVVNHPPNASNQTLQVLEDGLLPMTLLATDEESSPLRFTITTPPTNGVLTGKSPNLTYRPAPNYSGVDSFQFKADDGVTNSTPATISITVTPVNDAPAALAQSVSTAEDTTKAITLTASDPEGFTLTFIVRSLPGHGSLSGTAPNLSYLPNPDYHGPDSFTFVVSDGEFESAGATVSLMVTPSPDAPSISSLPDQSISTNSSLHLLFSIGDVDTPGTNLIVTAQSSNTALVPNTSGALQVSGTGATRALDIIPVPDLTGSSTITLTVSDGALSATNSFLLTVTAGGGSASLGGEGIHGYVAEAQVFFDANRNGIQDATEPAAQTDGHGTFNLKVPLANFDLNQNGKLDLEEGRLVLSGGTDIATGLPLAGVMTAPLAATVITPLTTVVEELQRQNPALDANQAEQLLMSALGIPSVVSSNVSLLRYDPFEAALVHEPNASVIQAASAKVYDTIVQTTALLDGSSVSSSLEIAASVTRSLAAQVIAAGELDLCAASHVKQLIEQSAVELNMMLSPAVLQGAAEIIAQVNQVKDEILDSGLTPPESLAQLTRVQHVAQADVSVDLMALGAGAVLVDDVVVAQTGASLTQAILAAPVGDLTGFDTRAGIVSFNRSQFQVREGGVAFEAVTLNREHGTRGEITALVILQDGTATVASGDYTPGAIEVRFADGEISKIVGLSNRVVMDGQLEGNETIHLSVSLAPDAPAGAVVGFQSTAMLTVIDADSPGTFAFTGGDFEVRENGVEPNTVTIARTGGTLGAVTVVLTPAAVPGGATAEIDFAGSEISVTFPAGAQYRRVPIPVMRDSLSEGNERFSLTLSLAANAPAGATLGARKTATVLILDVPNTAPIANARTLVTLEDAPLSVTLTGQDNEEDPLTLTILQGPAHGTLTGTAPNLLYRPHTDFNGADSFTFKASDGLVESAFATISINVVAVNDRPIVATAIADQSGQYGTAFSFTFAAGTFTDVDLGQTLIYSAAGLPPGVTLNSTNRNFSGTPASAGSFPVTLTAIDNGSPALSITAHFTASIAKAPLSVTANNAARDHGQENPPLTGVLAGVVNNDQITATYSTTATASSTVGAYPIVPSLFDLESKLGHYTVNTINGTLTVKNVAPVVNAGPDQEKVALDEVTFGGSFTDPSSPNHTIEWNFGDGSLTVTGALAPKHTYAKHGEYIVSLTVKDSHGASASDTLKVTVMSAWGCVTEALEGLKPFVKESKRLEKVVKDLTASLEAKLWLDEVHLNPKGGRKAFVYWRQATDLMEQLLKPSKKRPHDPQDGNDGEDDDEFKQIFNDPKADTLSTSAVKAIEEAMADVICASTLISETLYLENESLVALDPRKQNRVDAALARAKEYLEEASVLAEKGESGTAVRRYIRSWNNTQEAIEVAGQSQSAKELAQARDLIEQSLDPKDWLDELHLDLMTGAKTFNLMQSAARELANVVLDAQKGRVIASVGQGAETELSDLLERARAKGVLTWH